MELWRKDGPTDFETSSPILKACIKNQEERLTSAIIKLRDVNSNDKKVSTAQAFLPKVIFWPSIK